MNRYPLFKEALDGYASTNMVKLTYFYFVNYRNNDVIAQWVTGTFYSNYWVQEVKDFLYLLK